MGYLPLTQRNGIPQIILSLFAKYDFVAVVENNTHNILDDLVEKQCDYRCKENCILILNLHFVVM